MHRLALCYAVLLLLSCSDTTSRATMDVPPEARPDSAQAHPIVQVLDPIPEASDPLPVQEADRDAAERREGQGGSLTGRSPVGDKPDSSGRSDAEIQMVVRNGLGAVKSCYRKHLQDDPGLRGLIRCRLSIADSGRVRAVDLLSNTTGSASLARCVVQTMRTWRFKPIRETGRPSVVTIALPFDPEG